MVRDHEMMRVPTMGVQAHEQIFLSGNVVGVFQHFTFEVLELLMTIDRARSAAVDEHL